MTDAGDDALEQEGFDVVDPGSRLVEFGRGVARAATIDEVMAVLTDVAGPLVHAANATAMLMDEERSKLVVYHGPAARTPSVRHVDLSDPTPAAEVARTGEPVYLGNLDALTTGFPRFVAQLEQIGWAAIACIPLLERGEVFGVLAYRWNGDLEFTPPRRDLIETLSELVGHAFARARNHDHLLAYARRLRDSNRDLDTFASAVAHDLRQPLRQVSSYVDVLLDHVGAGAEDSDAIHYAERIRAGVARADRLIIALLDYARAGGKSLTDDEVDLVELVGEVRDGLRLRLHQAGASVDVAELPVVQGDRALLTQLVQNLLDNAAKYRDPTRPLMIAIRAAPAGRDDGDGRPWWCISVCDNGVGIAAEHLGKVFDVFTQAQSGARLSGTGIGLATAKRVVERHGGVIEVDSTPGHGSTFSFTLPGPAGRHTY